MTRAKRILSAKISRPRLFGMVPREHLFARLDRSLAQPLTWVWGPPGAGKTALVASYVAERARSAVWYQVDIGDRDPASLFHYLSLAAETPAALPQFAPEHVSDVAAFARIFFRALFGQAREGTVLVLDNCQEASSNEAFFEIIRQAVMECPSECSLIAISRTDSPPAFAQLTAADHMTKIGWDLLQLRIEEVRAIAAQRNFTDDWLVQALHQQSQGWAAGLRLMLERIGHPDDSARKLSADAHESVFDYFASLIFEQASELTRTTLLSVACLPRVTSSLAQVLSGCQDAPSVLEDFYRRRLFTNRRSGHEAVYEFHGLFRDFLRQRARFHLGESGFAEQRARCAEALEMAQDPESAIPLWLEAGRWTDAARLINHCAASLLSHGRRQTLIEWIHTIPEPLRGTDPWLIYRLGCAELQVELEQGIKTLVQARRVFRDNGDFHGLVECLSALLRGAFVGFHAMHVMEPWLDELIAEIQRPHVFTRADVELGVLSILCMSLFHIRPWHPLTQTAYERAEALLSQDADLDIALMAASSLLVVTSLCGDFERGDRILSVTRAHAAKDSASPSDAAWWFAHAGYLRFLEARYPEALELLEHGRRIAEANALRSVLEIILLWRSTVEWRHAGSALANETLELLEASPAPPIPMREAIRCQYRSRSAIHHGHMEEAAALAEAADAAVLRSGSRLQEVVFSLCDADLLIHVGRAQAARKLLLRSQALIARTPIYDCWHAVQAWQAAWLALAEGDTERALMLVRQALILASTGQRRYFLRLPDCALVPMLKLALDHGIEIDMAREIIQTLHIQPPKNAPDTWPWPVRVYTLGRFKVQAGGKPLEFPRKVPRKTLLLLKVLVAFGGQEVPEQALCDALWADEEGDSAAHALAVTVVRLRKLLGTSEAVTYQAGKVTLAAELCWVDAWSFDQRVTQVPNLLSTLELYGGSFLPEDEGEAWSVATRERLRGKFIHALSRWGTHLESQGALEQALAYYQRGIDADPIVEDFHVGQMRCYDRLGQRAQALSVYRRYKHTLSVLLGVPPTESAHRLFREMLGQQAQRVAPDNLVAINTTANTSFADKPAPQDQER